MKKLTLVLLAAGLAITAACSSGSSSTSASWTPEAKAGVRQLMAMAAEGDQLDCAANVITDLYSPEDWTFVMTRGLAGMGNDKPDALPARLQAKDDEATRLMESRCGIADTRAEDAQEAAEMDAWNAAVGEWNTLTKERDATYGRDKFVDGVIVAGVAYPDYEAWATANGKPLTSP